jgi:hypothetical protein
MISGAVLDKLLRNTFRHLGKIGIEWHPLPAALAGAASQMKWHAYTLNTEIPLNTSAYTKKHKH